MPDPAQSFDAPRSSKHSSGHRAPAAREHAGDDWPVLDFLLRYRNDQEEGVDHSLKHYLGLYPEHEAIIAGEYLRLRHSDRAVGKESDAARYIAGFEIEQELGRGGEGVVYRARDALLHRRVALKVVSRPVGDLDEARLLRAAALAARLDHEALVKVYGAGRDEGTLWVASAFVDGSNLAAELEGRRRAGLPFGDRELAALLAPVARGLQHAHENGVVHRDVKPGNLLLRRDGALLLADFGMARDGDPTNDLTAPDELRGTPAYMAPERYRTGACGPQVDIYALGVVAFECASLRPPFRGLTHAATMSMAERVDVWSLPAWRNLGSDLRAILAMAMAKDPKHRYATAQALAEDLERLTCGRPVMARTPGRCRRARVWLQRHPTAAVGFGLAVIALATGLIVTMMFLRREQVLREEAQGSAARAQRIARSILFDNQRAVEFGGTPVVIRHRLVRQATEALRELVDNDPQNTELQRELCLAEMRLGEILAHTGAPSRGDVAAARGCYRRAERIAREKLAEDPRRDNLLAACMVRCADLLMVDGSVAQATGLYEQVVAMLDPRDRERRSIRGSAMGMLAVRWRDAGDLEQARRWIERAQKEFRIDVQDESCRDGLLSANMTSATILAEAGDPQAAVQLLRSELGRFATAGPGLVRQAHLRAHFDRVLANCLLMAGRRDEALPILDAGVERCRALLARDESDRGAAYRLIEMLMLRERVHGEATGESDSDRVEAAAIAAQYGFASHANPAPSAHRLPR